MGNDKSETTITKALEKVTPTQDAIGKLPVFLAGAGLGLLAAYMLDPQHGQTRRAKLRDQSDHGWRSILRRVSAALHDFTHRSTPSATEAPREALKQVKKTVEKTVEDTIAH